MIFKQVVILLLLVVAFMAGVSMVSATSEAMNAFNEEYSTNNTRLATCTVCHGSDVESLNPYGMAYQENEGDFVAIEPLDSDGDDFNNLDEIHSLTFPGDSEDYPEPTAEIPRETEPTAEEPPTETTDQQTPGFEGVLAFAGVVMAIYLLRRK